jgi:hypothetical protein
VSVWLTAGGEGGDVLAFRILPVGSLVPGPTQPVLPDKKGIKLRVLAVKETHAASLPPPPFRSAPRENFPGIKSPKHRIEENNKLLAWISMDQITIKTPNPKYFIYWCLIEFRVNRLEMQSVMLIFSIPLVN